MKKKTNMITKQDLSPVCQFSITTTFKVVGGYDGDAVARLISHSCFRFGYRVMPSKTKEGSYQPIIDSSDMTIEYIRKRLQALNPDRKRPVKRVTIPLFDLRRGKVKVCLTFTTGNLLGALCIYCEPTEIITDLDDLKKCN